MKKYLKQTIAAVVIAAVAGVGGYALLSGGSDKYLNIIPKDAQAVGRLDVHALLKQAKLSDEQVQQLGSRISGTDDQQELDLGLDLSQPIYGFVSSSGYFGMTASVADADKVEQALASPTKGGRQAELQRQRGYSWAVISGNYMMAFDAEKMLVMGPAVGAALDQLRNEMYGYLQQKADQSGRDSRLFADLKKVDVPAAAVLTMGVLPKPMRESVMKYVPAAVDNDVRLGLQLNIHEHGMQVATQLIADDDEALAKLNDFGQLMRPIDGTLLNAADEGALAWACLNIKGTDALPQLRTLPVVRLVLMGLNMMIDADQMLNAIDGDVAIQLMAPSGQQALDRMPVKLNACLANTDFLKNVDYWVRSSRRGSVRALSPTDFALNMAGIPLWFGTDQRVLYVTNDDALRRSSGNSYLAEHKRDIAGHRFFVSIDMNRAAPAVQLPASLSRLCQRVNVSMKELGELKLDAEGPQDTNFLYELLNSAIN